jgi:hypothetical protein
MCWVCCKRKARFGIGCDTRVTMQEVPRVHSEPCCTPVMMVGQGVRVAPSVPRRAIAPGLDAPVPQCVRSSHGRSAEPSGKGQPVL